MITRQEVDKVVDSVLDHFNIDLNKLSLTESIEFYNEIYHSVGII